MSSSNSIFRSVTSEKRWVIDMYNLFPQDHVVDVDFDDTCVFKVPESLCQTKPEAYIPQHIGLGPYHHLRPELYPMQKKKLSSIMKFLTHKQRQNFRQVVEALAQQEPLLRACYNEYLDLDSITLAWIIAIDATYLLKFFVNYRVEGDGTAKDLEMEKLVADFFMLENQIPLALITEVLNVLGEENTPNFLEKFRDLCTSASPFEMQKEAMMPIPSDHHLLGVLYNFILPSRTTIPIPESLDWLPAFHKCADMEPVQINMKQIAESGAAIFNVPAPAQIIKSIAEKVPWDSILALLKSSGDEERPLVEEIDVPSVSELNEILGIKFELTDGGIRNVSYDEEDKKFSLPVIKIKSNSEVVLRNLLAYEAASAKPGSVLELAEYIDLMCGIVDTSKDVSILRTEKIIESRLSDAEIARIFNGIRKSTGGKNEKRTDIEKAIEKVNEKYDNVATVKVRRFMKEHIYSSWKFLSFLTTLMVLVMLALQAFCEFYQCKERWFK